MKALEGAHMYESLHELVQPYLTYSFDDLPDDVAKRVTSDFFPHSWQRCTPAERSLLSLERDKELDPALSEHAHWFSLQSKLVAAEQNIAKIVSARQHTGDEYEGEDALVGLRSQMSELKEEWHRPDFPLGSSQQLAVDKNRARHCPQLLAIPDALKFLAENTGRQWTLPQLLSVAAKCRVSLYADVPPWAPVTIIRNGPDGFFSRDHIEPGCRLLALLDHDAVKSLWTTGTAQPRVACYPPFPEFGDLLVFTNPVSVSLDDIRITTERLLRLLTEWEGLRHIGAIAGEVDGRASDSPVPAHEFESTTGRRAAARPVRTDALPSRLLELVLHQIHGVEEDQLTAYLAGGVEEIVKRKTFGPERWIRRVKERGVLTAIQFVAIINFALHDFDSREQDEEIMVTQWAESLLNSADSGEIVARDPHSLLPLAYPAKGLDWVILLPDAEKFITARGMEWKCGTVIDHLFSETMQKVDGTPTEKECVPIALAVEASNVWDEAGLARLLKESNEPGMTQKKLADKYNVSRQRIGALLKYVAPPRKTSPFDALGIGRNKK
jgi:hypothetical protein